MRQRAYENGRTGKCWLLSYGHLQSSPGRSPFRHTLHMGKEKGFALSPIKTSQMRRFLERQGYAVEAGQHKHLKLKHETYAPVLLPLKPGGNLSQPALKQIAAAMGLRPEDLV